MFYESKEKLGRLGEEAIYDFFTARNSLVELSDNKFDAVKDLTIDGKLVEVKTRVLIQKDKGFWIEKNQWNKLNNVDRLLFVEVPLYADDPIKIFESNDPKKGWFGTYTSQNEPVRVYPLTELTLIGKIDNIKLGAAMRRLSGSKYLKEGNRPDESTRISKSSARMYRLTEQEIERLSEPQLNY